MNENSYGIHITHVYKISIKKETFCLSLTF